MGFSQKKYIEKSTFKGKRQAAKLFWHQWLNLKNLNLFALQKEMKIPAAHNQYLLQAELVLLTVRFSLNTNGPCMIQDVAIPLSHDMP